jgi:hypothetical protein
MCSGCFNPDDIFPLKGTVTSADPVEGQVIKLLRDSKQAGFGGCSGALATDFKQTTADANGNFSFEVFRAQTQSLTNFSPFCFRVSAQFPSGSRAWSDLSGIFDETHLSPLPDWQAAPQHEHDGLQFRPPSPRPAFLKSGRAKQGFLDLPPLPLINRHSKPLQTAPQQTRHPFSILSRNWCLIGRQFLSVLHHEVQRRSCVTRTTSR